MVARSSAIVAVTLCLGGCSNEYVCPDPIGPIIRDDCDAYRTRYESLKVELGFSIGNFGVSAVAGKEKLRDPSELLQLLMQQTMALCKDFNACRVPSPDYQRRREDADRKFTAITAISQQLKGDLDETSKRRLVEQLIDVLSGESRGGPTGRGARARRPRVRPAACKHFLPSLTSFYFGSRFQPPRPKLPPGVPALAWYEMTHARGIGLTDTHIHVKLWGETEADDMLYVTLDGGHSARAKVRGTSKRPEARASFRFERQLLWERGTMTLEYRVGATLKKHALGSVRLDPERWRSRAYLAYMPDPIRRCPIEYERPWLVFFSRLGHKVRTTVRCEHDGKPVPGVLEGTDTGSTYRASHLDRHHVELPIRVPLKGGRTRGTWKARMPGEALPVDKFPDEAKGLWRCRVSFNGRVGRRSEFRMRPDGSVVYHGRPGTLSPPWWPVKTEHVENDVERRRDAELAKEETKAEARHQKMLERRGAR